MMSKSFSTLTLSQLGRCFYHLRRKYDCNDATTFMCCRIESFSFLYLISIYKRATDVFSSVKLEYMPFIMFGLAWLVLFHETDIAKVLLWLVWQDLFKWSLRGIISQKKLCCFVLKLLLQFIATDIICTILNLFFLMR